jgi:hypothetical protein
MYIKFVKPLSVKLTWDILISLENYTSGNDIIVIENFQQTARGLIHET